MIYKSKNFGFIQLVKGEIFSIYGYWRGDKTEDSLENALFHARFNFDIDSFETAIFDKFGNYYPIKK